MINAVVLEVGDVHQETHTYIKQEFYAFHNIPSRSHCPGYVAVQYPARKPRLSDTLNPVELTPLVIRCPLRLSNKSRHNHGTLYEESRKIMTLHTPYILRQLTAVRKTLV